MSFWSKYFEDNQFAFEDWAADHETSEPICQAVAEKVDTFEEMELVWDGPTPEQENDILARAWELASVGTTALYWGERIVPRS